MGNELSLLVCETFMPEVQAVLAGEYFSGVKVKSYPVCCQQARAKGLILCEGPRENVADDSQTCVIGCRGLAGIDRPSSESGPDHGARSGLCFDLLIGRTLTESLMREGAYLVTPGWLSHWRETMARWGFDQPTAREYFAESVTRLVLLDSGVNPGSRLQLEELAAFLARPFQVLPVGLDLLRLFLTNLVLQRRLKNRAQSVRNELADANRKLGDYAMVHDLIGRMTGLKSEDQVIDAIFELFSMLFAPSRLVYVQIGGGQVKRVKSHPPELAQDCSLAHRLLGLEQDYAWTASQNGFALRVGEPQDPSGVLEAEQFAFPQYREHYLNLALSLGKVCGLSIRNARAYEQLSHTNLDLCRVNAELKQALDEVKTLSGMIPICCSCKKIRDDNNYWNQVEVYIMAHTDAQFTHGMCPECCKKYFPGIDVSELASEP